MRLVNVTVVVACQFGDKFIRQRRRDVFLHGVQRNLELCRLARKVGVVLIGVGEGGVHRLGLACNHADDAVLKVRQHGAVAENQLGIRIRTTLEFNAVQRADIVNVDGVALGSRALHGREGLVCFQHFRDFCIHGFVVHGVNMRQLDRQVLVFARGHILREVGLCVVNIVLGAPAGSEGQNQQNAGQSQCKCLFHLYNLLIISHP